MTKHGMQRKKIWYAYISNFEFYRGKDFQACLNERFSLRLESSFTFQPLRREKRQNPRHFVTGDTLEVYIGVCMAWPHFRTELLKLKLS